MISVVHTWTSVLIIFVLYLYSKLQTDKEITFMLSFLVQCIIHPAGGCHWLVPCVEDVISQSQIDHLLHPIFGCGAQTSKNFGIALKRKFHQFPQYLRCRNYRRRHPFSRTFGAAGALLHVTVYRV